MTAALRYALVLIALACAGTALAQEAPVEGETPEPGETEQPADDTAADPDSDIDPEARERADLHLASARSHVRAGHPDRAIGDFTSAYEITHDPAILLEVAEAQEAMLQLPQALSAYEAFLATDSQDQEARAGAARRVRLLRQRIATIQGTRPPPDRPPARHDDDDDDDDDDEPYDPVPRLIGNVVLFGLAGVGLVTAAVFGGLVLAEDGELKDGCGATLSCRDEDLEDLGLYRLTTDVAFFASFITALGGLLFFLTTPDPEPEPPSSEAHIRVTPWLGGDAGGFVAAGRF